MKTAIGYMLVVFGLIGLTVPFMPDRPVDVATVTPCATEEGAGYGQPYPCVWDALSQGNRLRGPYAARWTLYVRGDCPALPDDTVCVPVDWEVDYIRVIN